jgi:NitT/TauT family transport system permease protein
MAGVLAGWEALARFNSGTSFYVGSPWTIAGELWRMIHEGTFVRDLTLTGMEAAIGLAIGMSVGTALGLGLWCSERLAAALRPIATVLGAIPIIALGPLMIVWFGVGTSMKIAMATLTTVFIAFSQSYRGAQLVSADLIETVAGLGARRRQVLTKIVIPGSIDWVLNSMRLNVGMGLLGAFMGEFIASQAGLGYRLLRSASLYNVPAAFAAAFGIVLLGVSFDGVALLLERKRHVIVQWLCIPLRLRRHGHRAEETHG